MGFRFRKSFDLGGARVNLSKKGIGASVGTKGFRVTKKAGGGTRTTTTIPGTGISYTKDSSNSSSNAAGAATASISGTSAESKMFAILFRVLSLPLIAIGALLALIEMPIGWVSMAGGIGCWLLANKYKKKHKKMQEGA